MKVGIHQPHYFPWLGYLDKMAKSDIFVVLDEVQLTDRSPMLRNKFLQAGGQEHMLGLSVQKKGYREKMTKEIELANTREVLEKHRRFIQMNYCKTQGYQEVWPEICHIFEKDYRYLIEIQMDTIEALRKLLRIETRLVYQSEIDYDKESKNSGLMLSLCEKLGATVYLSGQGAKKYMIDEDFVNRGIMVEYQQFSLPRYVQKNAEGFVANLSALDFVMQLGVEKARKVFWDNVSGMNN